MKPWRRLEARRVEACKIFDLDHVRFERPEGVGSEWFYVVESIDWINVIAIDDDHRVLMVRQYRFGIEDFTLEIPGGMCDPGEQPLESARRELREETGFEADRWDDLGWVHPNPPIQNNRCFTFLARGLRRVGDPRPDPNEAFEQMVVPLADVSRLILERRITHALVLAAFHRYQLFGEGSAG
ncbi:MAG: NUDIX hydrolase [Acidobacteriota bacterium]|nr:NUDIX hydrolase [Acidobacteriota bacterium]MDH3786451.1 NUDIX hydrolase [Acidobacteriota bacterium]